MSTQEIKELLEKQLRLLSEQSQKCAGEKELAELSSEMVKVASLLLS